MKVKSKKSKVEFYHQMIAHIDSTWKKAKGSVHGYPFVASDFKDLKHFAVIYGVGGVMALWDRFIAQKNEHTKRSGHSLRHFQTSLPALLDDPIWKRDGEKYNDKLYGKLPEKLTDLLPGLVLKEIK